MYEPGRIIHQGHGFAVLEIDGKMKVSWAEGLIGKPVFYDISEANFEKIKKSEKDANEVLFFFKYGNWSLEKEDEIEADKNFIRECPELLLEIPENQKLFDKEELEMLLKIARDKHD